MAEDLKAEKAVADMTPQEAKAELAKREADKMTRRAALAKIGVQAGLGLLAAFSVDDLARLVAKRMEQQAGQNAAVDKVARELHSAGVAFATITPTCHVTSIDEEGNIISVEVPCDELTNKCKGACSGCCNNLKTGVDACATQRRNCTATPEVCDAAQTECVSNVGAAFDACFNTNQCNCGCG